MSEPLRYDPGCEPDTLDTEAVMFQCPNGGFVKWQDYALLKADAQVILKHLDEASADCARLKSEVGLLKHKLGRLLGAEQEWELVEPGEYARLKAEVERLRKAGDKLVDVIQEMDVIIDMDSDHPEIKAWNAAKEGKQP